MINLNKKGFKIILGILVISIMLLIIGTTNVHATNKLYVENMLTHTQRLAADVDGDGFITKKDKDLIMQKISDKSSKFPVQAYKLGDINRDKKTAISDVTLLQRYLAGEKNLTSIQKLAADVNGDKNIDSKDLNLISQKINEIITKFPLEDFKYGDLNRDGKITILDVTLLNKYLLENKNLTDTQKLAADVDGDGLIGTNDMNLIQKRSNEMIPKFPTEEFKPGDVNCNGVIDIADTTMIDKYLAGEYNLSTTLQTLAADVDGDGVVTKKDALLIQKKNADFISSFPIENFIIGDVNLDGKVSIADTTLLKRYINGKVDLSNNQKLAADVNGDRYINQKDYELIQQKSSDIISKFPLEAFKLGDVNCDGIISIQDTTLLQQYIGGKKFLNDTQMLAADVNGDKYIDDNDIKLIQQKANEKILRFPIEEIKYGDVNDDGLVNITDVELVNKLISGKDISLCRKIKNIKFSSSSKYKLQIEWDKPDTANGYLIVIYRPDQKIYYKTNNYKTNTMNWYRFNKGKNYKILIRPFRVVNNQKQYGTNTIVSFDVK